QRESTHTRRKFPSMSFSDRIAGMRERLRHRWMYRSGDGTAAPTAGAGAAASAGGFFSRLDRPGMRGILWRFLAAFIVFILLYYPIGMMLVHKVDDDPDFAPSAA